MWVGGFKVYIIPKTNPVGETTDLRYVKNGVVAAVRSLRAETSDRVVPLTLRAIARRFTAAAESHPPQM